MEESKFEWKANALEAFTEIARRCEGRRAAIFLDYDGTLSPIVNVPAEAFMPPRAHKIVDKLARHALLTDVSIVTGRGLDTVKEFVGSDEVNYAASHGYEILCSDGSHEQFAEEFLPYLQECYATLDAETKHLQAIGARLEDKKFSLSIHYRNVPPSRHAEVDDIVERVLKKFEGQLLRTFGKMVYDVRPLFQWHKGEAVLYLLDRFIAQPPPTDLDKSAAYFALYIGDDVTDEDAFRSLESRTSLHSQNGSSTSSPSLTPVGNGATLHKPTSNGSSHGHVHATPTPSPECITILVSEKPRRTAANFSLKNTSEVSEFLEKLQEVIAKADSRTRTSS